MKTGDDLYQLIQSLSHHEKRYFKIFASRHVIGEKNKYELLFDLIDRQVKNGVYKEDELKRKAGRLADTNLASSKHYLYDLILRSMRSFNENHLTTDNINKRIEDIRFLMNKGLYNKCLQMISSTKKLCYRYAYYKGISELLQLQRSVLHVSGKGTTMSLLNDISCEEMKVYSALEKEMLYRQLYDRSLNYFQQASGINFKATETEIEKLSEHPFLLDDRNADTFNAKLYYHNTLSIIAQYKADYALSMLHSGKAVQLYDDCDNIQKEQIKAYITALQNYGNSCFLAGDMTGFPALLKKLKNIKTGSQEEDIAWKRFKYNLEINYLANANKYEEALRLIPEIEDWLLKYDHRLPDMSKLAWIYNIGQICFLNAYYDKSLHWFNKITLKNWKDVRKDLQNTARIFQILIQYELKNYNLATALLYNLKRGLKRNDVLDDFEMLYFRFLNKLIKACNTHDQALVMMEWKIKLQAGKKLKPENITACRDILLWLDKKLMHADQRMTVVHITKADLQSKNSAKKQAVSNSLSA